MIAVAFAQQTTPLGRPYYAVRYVDATRMQTKNMYRNGRHWLRVQMSSTLLKFRDELTWQLRKRRPNRVWAQATLPWRSLE